MNLVTCLLGIMVESENEDMGVDYTPSRGSYGELSPFRFWCQKVLPLVYDDSLSYYELLCKALDYLNKTMEDVGTLNVDVTGLYEAYVKLQGYVNGYFDNLDVQEEINNKLDKMASSGELNYAVKHGEPNSISMGMLTQDVKEAMTGGSVPVVGIDAISSENIKNVSVDMYKLKDTIDNGSVKPNSPLRKGYYSNGTLHFAEESLNVLLAIDVKYGEKYTIYRSILDEWFVLSEIEGDFVNNAPAKFVYQLGINGYRGYYYTPSSESVTKLVINFHKKDSLYTVSQLFNDLHVIKGVYNFSAFNYNDFVSNAYRFVKPRGYGVSLNDVYAKDKQPWAEGILGAGDTFKLAKPIDVPSIAGYASNFNADLSTIKYSELISQFDKLFDAENRKTIIGYATQDRTETEPNYNYPIYMYRYESSVGNVKNSFGFRPIRILITSGVHGDEKGAPYSLLKLLEIMLDQTNNSLLREAFHNINIDFIPCVNPWGYDNWVRENARGVNLNRNFSYRWDKYNGSTKGTAPLSEIESNSVAQLIYTNQYDYIIDWHEASLSNGTYVATENKELAKHHVLNCRKMFTSLYTRYNLYPVNSGHGVAELNTIPALANEMLAIYGINNGLIYEQAWGDTDTKWTSRIISEGVEMFGNLLLSYARTYGLKIV